MEQIVVTMTRERETKRTWRFTEGTDEPVIGTLYAPKSALRELGDPGAIKLVITPG